MTGIVVSTGVSLVGGSGVQNNTLNAGDVVTARVTFNSAVDVTGLPTVTLNIGGTLVQAVFAAGSGTNTLSFNYTVLAGQTDLNGVALEPDSLALNGGAMTAGGVPVALTNDWAGDNQALYVDTTAPTVFFAGFHSDDAVVRWATAGAVVTGILTFLETVYVTGTPTLGLTIGSKVVQASYASGSGTNEIRFNYTVADGDIALAGPGIAANTLSLNGGSLQDAAGNAASLEHLGYAAFPFVRIDAVAPAVFAPAPFGSTVKYNIPNNISVSDVLGLLFTEQVRLGSGKIDLRLDDGTLVESFDAATSTSLVQRPESVIIGIDPAESLLRGTTYRIEFHAGSVVDHGMTPIAETVVRFSTVTDTITATAVGGSVAGTAANDILQGLGGAEVFTGGAGNDTIIGGEGRDTANFSGQRSAYTVHFNGTTAVVDGPDGTDALQGVERLHFSDANVALDIAGNAGQAYRLYQAAFDRVPDIGGLGYQMHDLDLGYTLAQVAANFIASPEFQSKYGGLTDDAFIALLYVNVLHRTPAQEEIDFHVANELHAGYSRAHVLTFFSESPENQVNVIGDIQNGMDYTL